MYDIPLLLHRVVHQLDRAADRTLQQELGLSHRRAIVLLIVESDGPLNQRDLAALLGHTEPAISAMMRELSASHLVRLQSVGGRERQVSITDEGSRIVAAARALMTPKFDELVAATGIDDAVLGEQLQRLAGALGVAQ